MLGSVYTKALRDRWLSTLVGAGTLALFLLLGLATYREIDLSIYTGLPEAFRSLIGIPEGADATSLAFAAIYGSYGSLALAGIAISIGSGSIAGEERDGTFGLLLGNPRGRADVLRSKAAALVTLAAAGAVVLYLAGYASAAVLGVELGDAQVGALIVHLLANTLFHGFLALAVGSWTGRRPLASGVAVAVMVVGWVGQGLLPLVESLADLVHVLPWDWFAGSQPFVNGLAMGDLALLLGGTAVFATASFLGLERRDLRARDGRTSLLDRLRTLPATRRIMDRLAGRARVSGIAVKTASEHQGVLVVAALLMFWMMGVLMAPMYDAIKGTLAAMSDLPDVILAVAGGGDMTTPEGWYRLETFGLMAPSAVMALTILVGSRGLAGEEHRRTMSILLANPVPRSRIVLEKVVAMVVLAIIVGASTAGGVAAGNAISGLGMDVGNIVAASALSVLVGLVFGGVALALGAATGVPRVATFGTIGIVLLTYLANNLLPLAEGLAGWARWSPFHYYLGNDPLLNGMDWGNAAVLVVLFAVLVAAAVALFERRDLRQG